MKAASVPHLERIRLRWNWPSWVGQLQRILCTTIIALASVGVALVASLLLPDLKRPVLTMLTAGSGLLLMGVYVFLLHDRIERTVIGRIGRRNLTMSFTRELNDVAKREFIKHAKSAQVKLPKSRIDESRVQNLLSEIGDNFPWAQLDASSNRIIVCNRAFGDLLHVKRQFLEGQRLSFVTSEPNPTSPTVKYGTFVENLSPHVFELGLHSNQQHVRVYMIPVQRKGRKVDTIGIFEPLELDIIGAKRPESGSTPAAFHGASR